MERFKFYPYTYDIEVFISGVEQTTHQVHNNDVALLNLIKICMSADVYGTLHQVHKLDVDIAMVKDIYSKKLEAKAATRATLFPCITMPNQKPNCLRVYH